MDRWRNDGNIDIDDEEAPFLNSELVPTQSLNLDENEQVLIGRAIPASAAFLGLAFIMCTLVVTGLPPLSGFIGKFAMLTNLINPVGPGPICGLPSRPMGLGTDGADDCYGLVRPDCTYARRHPPIFGPRTSVGHPSCASLRGCRLQR